MQIDIFVAEIFVLRILSISKRGAIDKSLHNVIIEIQRLVAPNCHRTVAWLGHLV
jgi:hypothetical protein